MPTTSSSICNPSLACAPEVAWVTTWVEGGLFTDDVFNQLSSQAMDGVGELNKALGALGI
jgi:hypothetical protein